MKEELNIALLQCDLHWENAAKNRSQIEEYLAGIIDADLILLPEMFNTGFSVASIHLAETMHGETVEWMKSIARQKSAVICGSLMIKEAGCVYNRLLWVEPDGNIGYYDKRHLFGLIDEDKYFTPGTNRLIVDYKGWKICPLICYDLRFPVFSRNDVNYDILIYIANWPDKRIGAWNALLKARAIENQAYVVGLNRVGVDGYNAQYSGHTQVIDADGNLIARAPENEVGLVELTLTKKHLSKLRSRLPFLDDQDSFELMND
jgi:predicted amidohydrolase